MASIGGIASSLLVRQFTRALAPCWRLHLFWRQWSFERLSFTLIRWSDLAKMLIDMAASVANDPLLLRWRLSQMLKSAHGRMHLAGSIVYVVAMEMRPIRTITAKGQSVQLRETAARNLDSPDIIYQTKFKIIRMESVECGHIVSEMVYFVFKIIRCMGLKGGILEIHSASLESVLLGRHCHQERYSNGCDLGRSTW